MIVRSSEAIAPGKRDEFMVTLADLVDTFRGQYAGLADHRILIDHDDADRVIYESTWTDVDALREFAGENWATEAVTFPGEDELLREPLRLRHFELAETHEDAEDNAPID